MALTLGFTGDVMLGRGVDRRQQVRPPAAIWGDMLDRLRSLDGLFINLECAIADSGERWTRTNRPFHFRADPDWAIDALRAAGVDWANLANNHALDFEEEALLETLEHLDRADILTAGAGVDQERACGPSFLTIGDFRIGILALTDNTPEFAASEEDPGTCQTALDVAARERANGQLEAIIDREPDLVIASLHWGPNMMTEPSEKRRRFGRWLVDQDVDLVHGHSAHVFNGVEVRDGSLILYDTGDFVDDYAVDDRLRNDRSFLFLVDVDEDGQLLELRLDPVSIYDCAVHRATDPEASWCRERMLDRSQPFEPGFERNGAGLKLTI